jgi:hypothetical protein
VSLVGPFFSAILAAHRVFFVAVRNKNPPAAPWPLARSYPNGFPRVYVQWGA